jgi:putative sigma-54 modulation protein
MINHIDMTGIRYDIDNMTKRYVRRKIGRLDRYVSRHARATLTAHVLLKQVNRANGNKYECEITLTLPDTQIVATDTTMNMLAAVDIVEAKLKTQLRKYKDEHMQRRRGLLRRFRRGVEQEAV